MPSAERRLLIAGCGDLGNRLSVRLEDWQVHGLRRDVSRLAAGIVPVRADLSNPSSLADVAGEWDAVVYTATPGERSPEGYRQAYVSGMQALLARVRARRLVMVSEPQRFNGEILLEAERIAADAGGIVVRFSGIYGPGRDYLVRSVRNGPVACRRDPPIWTNRIHSEDCAAALAHLLEMEQPEPLYLASDARPTPRWDVLAWLADRLDVPGPVDTSDDAGQGKRIDANRLFESGFALQYPDYRAGYEELFK